MRGIINSFLSEKKYGFIKGGDGKDYFFHIDAFKDHKDSICDGAPVEFDPAATPKGYRAHGCSLLDASSEVAYVVPDDFLTSSSEVIKGWEIIERGNWIVHGTSKDSPDAAKRDLISNAHKLGANALVDVNYYKTTGSEPGTGRGIHNFTIHNFRARIVTIGKKSAIGKCSAEDLSGINLKAAAVNQRFLELTAATKKKRNAVWVAIACLSVPLLATEHTRLILILIVLGIVFGRSTTYGSWLQAGR